MVRTVVRWREASIPFGLLNGIDDILAIPGTEADVAAVGVHMDWAGRLGGPVVALTRALNLCLV